MRLVSRPQVVNTSDSQPSVMLCRSAILQSDDMMLRTCDFSDIADKDPLLLFARALLCKEVVEVVLDGIVR